MIEHSHIAETRPSPEEIIDPFEHFAYLPFYVDLNRKMINCADLKEGERVLDIASGPGNISGLIAEKIGQSGRIVALDFSQRALSAAKRNLESIKTSIDFIRARAEDMGRLFNDRQFGTFDAAIIGNAIHNFTNKPEVFSGISRLLKPKRIIGFNTTFFEGAIPKEESRFYRLWMVIANRLAQEIEGHGDGSKEKVEARKLLTPHDYTKELEENGFKVKSLAFEEIEMDEANFVAISKDDEFARGALSKYSLEVAKKNLQEGVKRAFDQLGLVTSRRVWMQVVAERL